MLASFAFLAFTSQITLFNQSKAFLVINVYAATAFILACLVGLAKTALVRLSSAISQEFLACPSSSELSWNLPWMLVSAFSVHLRQVRSGIGRLATLILGVFLWLARHLCALRVECEDPKSPFFGDSRWMVDLPLRALVHAAIKSRIISKRVARKRRSFINVLLVQLLPAYLRQ